MPTPIRCPRVGIVILNWQRPADTTACLGSLERLDYPSYEIVVVDNGSDPHARASIRERFPTVRLLVNDDNLGFAAGSNVGIVDQMRRGVEYVLLLNDDTEVAEDFLNILVEVGEAEPDIGILGPSILYYDRPEVIWSAGGAVDALGEPRHLALEQPLDSSWRDVREVDYVTGCALLVKSEVVERVGVLDERFFAYFEETEWCDRARRAGFRVVHVAPARVWHKIESAARTTSRPYLYLMARNRLLYLRCRGANAWTIVLASIDLLRTAVSWSTRARHRDMRPFSGALVRGVSDFVLGRFGAPSLRV